MADVNIPQTDPDVGLSDAQVQQQIHNGNQNTGEESLTRSTRIFSGITRLHCLT